MRFLISALSRNSKTGEVEQTPLSVIHAANVRDAAKIARVKHPLPDHVARKIQPVPEILQDGKAN